MRLPRLHPQCSVVCLLDQITLTMRDDEGESEIDNNNIASTPPKLKPVFDEDRHITYTGEHVETESTKHNADKAVSCNSTATIETSRPDDFRQQVRENSDGEDYQVLIETESWRTAKNWRSNSCSSAIRSDRGKHEISQLLSRSSIFYFSAFNVLHTCSLLFRFSPRTRSPIAKIMVQKPVYGLAELRIEASDVGHMLGIASIMSQLLSKPFFFSRIQCSI